MNKIALFTFGCLIGIAGTLAVTLTVAKDQQPVAGDTPNGYALELNATTSSPAINTCDESKPLTPNQQTIDKLSTSDIDVLLQRLKTNPEALFDSQAFKDLAYLISKDKDVANTVRKMILNSESFEEKYALVQLLAEANSPETASFVIDMINTPNNETKRLGFELLTAMEIKENLPELNNALLDATLYEANPEFLADVIFRLSANPLDDPTKSKAVDRFQALLSSDNKSIKARAIDGLAQLGDQATISAVVKQHLHDTDADVRVSAIRGAFKLHPDRLDEEIIGALTNIIKNPAEPESARNIASAVLASQKSVL